jgi:hypothetical protein
MFTRGWKIPDPFKKTTEKNFPWKKALKTTENSFPSFFYSRKCLFRRFSNFFNFFFRFFHNFASRSPILMIFRFLKMALKFIGSSSLPKECSSINKGATFIPNVNFSAKFNLILTKNVFPIYTLIDYASVEVFSL